MAYGGEGLQRGSIVGIGIVSGREAIIRADDQSVKGGAWYPLTTKKIVRALDIAIENRLPSFTSAIPPADSCLCNRSYFQTSTTAAGSSGTSRSCRRWASSNCRWSSAIAAGGAYIPRAVGLQRDRSWNRRGLSRRTTAREGCNRRGFHRRGTGRRRHAHQRQRLMRLSRLERRRGYPDRPRDRLAMGPSRQMGGATRNARTAGVRSVRALRHTSRHQDPQFDMREIIARIVDGSRFHEYQPNYGTTLVCGYANIWGFKVGILANNGVLFNDSSLKGAHFIELCDQNNTPLVFLPEHHGLHDRSGIRASRYNEGRRQDDHGAELRRAFQKFTVMCNGSFGAGNYRMCGRAFDARLLFAWPNHQIGVMGGDQAANTLVEVKANQMRRAGKPVDQATLDRVRSETLAAYQEQTSAYYSTSEIWDDGVIDPVDTQCARRRHFPHR